MQPAALQNLLSTNPLLVAHKCTVRVVDKIASPSEVLQAYWDCLSDCVAVVEENGTARLKVSIVKCVSKILFHDTNSCTKVALSTVMANDFALIRHNMLTTICYE